MYSRKAENRPLMKVMCSLLLLAPCLSALIISCCKYFLINVKLRRRGLFECRLRHKYLRLSKKDRCAGLFLAGRKHFNKEFTFFLQFSQRQAIIEPRKYKMRQAGRCANTHQPCTSVRPTQHSNRIAPQAYYTHFTSALQGGILQ